MQGHRLRICGEKAQIWATFPAIGALKFAFGDLLLLGYF